jgi:ribosomal protein S18 acetylase RimI-like enzyme
VTPVTCPLSRPRLSCSPSAPVDTVSEAAKVTKSFAFGQSDCPSCHGDELHIGRATEMDASVLAQLFRISSDGFAEHIWLRAACPGECLLRTGSRLHASADGALSFKNALVAKRAGAVIGMVLGCSIFDLFDSQDIMDALLPCDLKLDEPHNVIVLGLAVFPESRTQGIGTKLLSALERRTSFLETGRIGVVCPDARDTARGFLEHRGYRELTCRPNRRSIQLTMMYKRLFFED